MKKSLSSIVAEVFNSTMLKSLLVALFCLRVAHTIYSGLQGRVKLSDLTPPHAQKVRTPPLKSLILNDESGSPVRYFDTIVHDTRKVY